MNNKLMIGVGAVVIVAAAVGVVVWQAGLGGDSPPSQAETPGLDATPIVTAPPAAITPSPKPTFGETSPDVPVPPKVPNRFPKATSGITTW